MLFNIIPQVAHVIGGNINYRKTSKLIGLIVTHFDMAVE